MTYKNEDELKEEVLREPIPLYGKKKFTIEEYLEFENASPEKHEYYQGEIFAMAGASYDHCEIATNLIVSLGGKLKNKPCRPYGSDLRLHIPQNTLFTYPDISIICRNTFNTEESKAGAYQPIVIVEILLPSTRNYDGNQKFALYKDIPSLKEYILIDSKQVHAQVFSLKPGNTWDSKEYKALNQIVKINAIKVNLSMKEINKLTKL
jgi:Uma2 family endonuclease